MSIYDTIIIHPTFLPHNVNHWWPFAPTNRKRFKGALRMFTGNVLTFFLLCLADLPCVPGGQAQVKRLIRLMQVPPWRQGLEWHSSTSYSQFTP